MTTTDNQTPLSQQRVELERAKAEALFASIGDGAIATDDRGYIQRINPVALQILGYQEDELIGKWFPKAILAEDQEENLIPLMERPISQAFLSGQPFSSKLFYRRKNGERFPAAVTVSPVMLQNRPIGAIEVFRDITKDYEVDRMRDEFISIASHQLRTPATGAKQYLGMLLGGFAGDLSERQVMMLQNAYDSNERQLRIVDDLLRVAQIDAGKVHLNFEKVNLVQLIKDVVREQALKFKAKEQNVVIRYESERMSVTMDVARMRMVFENLLDNACKYSPAKSLISLTVTHLGKNVKVKIKDQGVGISRADKEKLFRKFSRVDNEMSHLVSGSGLGLYWAKKIVDLHHGSIKISSQIGKGTVFTVSIPSKHVEKEKSS